MGISTKPQDDTKAMTDEYVKGANIAFLAERYNHTPEEVMAIVTKEPTDEPVVTQATEDAKVVEPKKDK